MNPAVLLALPVMLPLLGAAFALFTRRRARLQLTVSILTLSAILVVACVLMWQVHRSGMLVLQVGRWTPQLGIVLAVDRLSALMLLVSSIVTLAVLVYSSAQAVAENQQRAPIAIFHPSYLVLVAGVSIAFVAGDMFNLYVGFEVLLAASFVLLTLGGSKERVRAATVYVIVSLISSILFLTGVALVYMAVGSVNFAEVAVRMDHVDPGTSLMIEMVLLIAFGVKAAIFPLSAWLPDSYPTAPAPVTAVFAGLLTKVGIYGIIRLETLWFPYSEISTLLLVAAALSLIIGIMGAIAQTDLKRVLSFTLVSHMGYMLFGIGLTTHLGMTATVFYVAHHIIVQTTLFLAAGLVEYRGGSTNLAKLGGLARISPLLAVLFFVPAMNLGGIPPLSGFLGKVGLIEAGIQKGTPLAWVLVAVSVIASLLTLYAIAKVWNRAFWQSAPPEVLEQTRRIPRPAAAATAVLAAVSVALTVVAGPLMNYSSASAQALLDRKPYVEAVLGEAAAGQLVFRIADDGQRVEER